jgi:hypothetical protein
MSKNLSDLPANDDKMWKGAEVHGNLVPEHANSEDHYFVRIGANEAQCEHCDWGFHLDPGDEIKDGHLYNVKGELVV